MRLEIRGVELEMDQEVVEIEGASIASRDAGTATGKGPVARVQTRDGLGATIAAPLWPDGSRDIRLLDFWQGADEYRRLEHAGRLSLMDVDGQSVGLLRAMKHGGRGWPGLATVTWSDLDSFAGGDAKGILEGLGASTGTYAELNPMARRFSESPAFSMDDDFRAAFVSFALTRIIPIMVGFGRPGVEILN